jgi:hypothetical protein
VQIFQRAGEEISLGQNREGDASGDFEFAGDRGDVEL